MTTDKNKAIYFYEQCLGEHLKQKYKAFMNDFKGLKRKLLLEFGDAHIILSKQLNALQSVTVDDIWFDRKGQIVYIEGQIEYLELFHAKLSTTVNFVESCGHTSELGREFYRKLQFEKVLRILGQSMVKLATNCSKKLYKQIQKTNANKICVNEFGKPIKITNNIAPIMIRPIVGLSIDGVAFIISVNHAPPGITSGKKIANTSHVRAAR